MLDLIFFSSEANSLAGAGCPCSAILHKIKQKVSKIRLEKRVISLTYSYCIWWKSDNMTLQTVLMVFPACFTSQCVGHQIQTWDPSSSPLTSHQSPFSCYISFWKRSPEQNLKQLFRIGVPSGHGHYIFTVQYSSAVLVTLNNCHCFIGTNCPPWFYHLVGTWFWLRGAFNTL